MMITDRKMKEPSDACQKESVRPVWIDEEDGEGEEE